MRQPASPPETASDPPSGQRPRETPAPLPPTLWSRRDLGLRAGWAMVVASLTIAFGAMVRLLIPRVKPPRTGLVVLGSPEEFAVGEVSERWKKSHRFVLVREERGFYALRSVCTHLGCIPGWQPREERFKCFCHGSGFRRDGKNFEGPAPRPLERLGIARDSRGRLVVDLESRFRSERGEWQAAEAFLPYPPKAKGQG